MQASVPAHALQRSLEPSGPHLAVTRTRPGRLKHPLYEKQRNSAPVPHTLAIAALP